jgi:penicillin-binding protein-related factor A (putative recombinase)
MKFLSYRSYKKLVMDTTHPRKGNKVAFLINDCHADKIPLLRPLESMKGLRLFIIYRSSQDDNTTIELESLDEFEKAQSFAAYHSWPFTKFPDICLMINFGHADLYILVDYRQNRAKIAEFLRYVRPSPGANYSGRPLAELGVKA